MTASKPRPDSFRDHVPPDVREHLEQARAEIRKGMETFLPPEFFEHRDAAHREMLLAWRGALDAAIRRMDDKAPRA